MQFCTIRFGSDLYKQECKIRHEILRKPLGLNLYQENLDLEADYYHFGVIEKEVLVSCVVAIPIDNQKIKFSQMLVILEFQQQGIGTMLMKKAEKYLTNLGFIKFELNARKSAVNFYEKIDYQIVSKEFIEVSLPHIKMQKHYCNINV